MSLTNTSIFITGANRGIGHALLEEALHGGARRVYAGSRKPFVHDDPRVVPLVLDVTNAAQIDAAVKRVDALDVLINNAGQSLYDDLSTAAALEQLFAVNVFGMHAMTQACAPLLTTSRGSIVNVLSALALAPLPVIPAYCASKAAAFSLTQSLRALFASRGVSVHAVLTGPVDTEMTRDLQVPKSTPAAVAKAIFDGLARRDDDIFPDPMSLTLAEGWRGGVAKSLERQYAPFVPSRAEQ